MLIIYGIPNCTTVKKTLTWLTEHNIQHQFHDFRKQGLKSEKLQTWFEHGDWKLLLNKRSTAWRNLSTGDKETLTSDTAFELMLENPTLIKRPVSEYENFINIGFNNKEYPNFIKQVTL